MVTEDYVSFETAKLLKNKGFDAECLGTYSAGDKELSISSECPYSNDLNDDMFIAAPTLQMAMKWLREVHNYLILIDVDDGLDGYQWSIYYADSHEITPYTEFSYESSYEEACEEAIKYCLEHLI